MQKVVWAPAGIFLKGRNGRVLPVSDRGMAHVCCVQPDLVHAPGHNPDVDQAETSRCGPAQLRNLEHRLCKPPGILYMAWPSPAIRPPVNSR